MATLQGTFEDASGNVLLNTPHSYAYIESGTTATKAYAKGDLLVFKNQLCQANSSISTGTTLSIGGNVASTTVANQLSNINVYVGSDQKLHFVDHAGADSVLPFSSGKDTITFCFVGNYVGYVKYLRDPSQNRSVGFINIGTSQFVLPSGTYWPHIFVLRSTENATWTFKITIGTAGYYWIPNSANSSGRGSWQYKNKNDVVTLTGGIKDGADILIQYHVDLSEDT